MTNTAREDQEKLAAWLNRLIEIIRRLGGETWKALVQVASGKTAAIAIDGVPLQLSADSGEDLQLLFDYAVSPNSINFRSDVDTLRDIVAGRLTIDGAIANGRIYACNNLNELLGIYELVMRILADSAANPELQELWMEFDQSWSGSATGGLNSLLEGQKSAYGYLIESVPKDVLAIEIEPYLSGDRL